MANDKEIIKKLFTIAKKQQEIITKLAQGVNAAPPPQHLDPANTQKRPAEAILGALQEPAKSSVNRLEVQGDIVKVQFQPNKGTQQAYDSIVKTVTDLQKQNVLPGASYQIKVVA